MSIERSASSTYSTSADYALRLELATERQKRQLLEERLRQYDEKYALHQSTTSLLSKTIAEKAQLEEEYQLRLEEIEHLRMDNVSLASMTAEVQDKAKRVEEEMATLLTEKESLRLEVHKHKAEVALLTTARHRLEVEVADDSRNLSLTVSELADKNAQHSELQKHYIALSDRLRSLTEAMTQQESALEEATSTAMSKERLLQSVKAANSVAAAASQETMTRLSVLVMEEEQRTGLLLGHWKLLVSGCLQLEGDCAEWAQRHRNLESEYVAFHERVTGRERERAEADAARRSRLVSQGTITECTAIQLESDEREKEKAMRAVGSLSNEVMQLSQESRHLTEELEKERAVLESFLKSAQASVAFPARKSSATHSNQYCDPSVEQMFLHGETLVLRQRLEKVSNEIFEQSHRLDVAQKQNEALRSEVLGLQEENRMLEERHRLELQTIEKEVQSIRAAQQSKGRSRSPLADRSALEGGSSSRLVSPPRGATLTVAAQTHDATCQVIAASGRSSPVTISPQQEVEGHNLVRSSLLAQISRERDTAVLQRDMAQRELEVYQTTTAQLQELLRQSDSTKIARVLHEQEVAHLASQLSDEQAKSTTLQRLLSEERQKGKRLADECAELRTEQQLDTLLRSNKALAEERDALLNCVEETRLECERVAAQRLAEKDVLLDQAGAKLMEAADQLDALEEQKGTLEAEVKHLWERMDALLAVSSPIVPAHNGADTARSRLY